MSKMSELSAEIMELYNAAEIIIAVADSLIELFSGSDEPKEPQQTTEPSPTLEEVRAVLAEESRSGFTAEIHALLQKYGADRLSQLDPANYKALLADVEVLTDAN